VDRLEELASSLSNVTVRSLPADLSTDDGVDTVAELCATQPLTMLINNAGVAHYMPLVDLPADKARELVHVKVVAPTMLARAALPGMLVRGEGTIINVAGMIAFGGPSPQSGGRAVYTGTLAHLVAMTQTLHAKPPTHPTTTRPSQPRRLRAILSRLKSRVHESGSTPRLEFPHIAGDLSGPRAYGDLSRAVAPRVTCDFAARGTNRPASEFPPAQFASLARKAAPHR
jgi:NADP-dependent 3-hydroxy acid dehydrogenase YdfG